MRKIYLTFIVSTFLIQCSYAQAGSIFQPYLTQIKVKYKNANKKIKQKLDIPTLSGAFVFADTINPKSEWQLLGHIIYYSSSGGGPKALKTPIVHLYAAKDKKKTFDSPFIFNAFKIKEINAPPKVNLDELFSSGITAWKPSLCEGYLRITREDKYIGAITNDIQTESFYFKRVE